MRLIQSGKETRVLGFKFTLLNEYTHESESSSRTAARATWTSAQASMVPLISLLDWRRWARLWRMDFLSSRATFWSYDWLTCDVSPSSLSSKIFRSA
jgi:hypothetical protein